MSFRARLTIAATAAVAIAVVAASAVTYVLLRNELRDQLDVTLRERAESLPRLRLLGDPDGEQFLGIPDERFGGVSVFTQLVRDDGEAITPPGTAAELPVSDRALSIAKGELREEVYEDATVEGTHVRVLTLPLREPGYALQVARSLEEVDSVLRRTRRLLFALALAGIALAALLGLLVARAVLAPVQRLTRTAEEVSETRDLSRRIDASGTDELSRLASTFNAMLGALEDSARAQRQLVSDASHELRTPLTSLRTNIEVLARDEAMAAEDREALLRDVTEQLVEMTALIAELVELARGDQAPADPEDVRLDLVTADAIERTRRNRPGVTVAADLEESFVQGVPSTIERAISNLLDNAAKWSPLGGEVEVRVRGGEVVVRDHGPGIDPADIPFVFDRFYRAPSARGLPGSGLGLAIVRQVAEAHGGTVTVEAAEGGGTRMTFSLPANS